MSDRDGGVSPSAARRLTRPNFASRGRGIFPYSVIKHDGTISIIFCHDIKTRQPPGNPKIDHIKIHTNK